MMGQREILTVSELNRAARELLETHFSEVWVKGEISNLTRAASGHLYFTLKDASGELSAVRFRSRSPLLADTAVESGTLVLAFGRLTIYEPRGRYQFVASLIQPISAGALQLAFEKLKQKLQDEGLFAPERKQPIPPLPRCIGVITSATGAAFRDIASVLERRWPAVGLYLFPSAVQGSSAPDELRAALERAIRFSRDVAPLDTLIIGRGGGSAEDLAAFNDEELARAIVACPIPVLSAVGHEIDFSIADFVADHRAPTPSAAAEVVAPDTQDIISRMDAAASRMRRAIGTIVQARESVARSQLRGYLFDLPRRRLETLEQRLDLHVASLLRGISTVWTARERSVRHAEEVLRLSNPSLPLERGYSLTTLAGSSTPLRDAEELEAGTAVETRLSRGRFTSRVEEVNPE